jgi:hypothetical protein
MTTMVTLSFTNDTMRLTAIKGLAARAWRGLCRRGAAGAMAALAGALSACSSPPKYFESPQAAVDSFVAALRAGDMEEQRRILGPGGEEALDSGDAVADANARAEFVRLYDEKHRLVEASDVVNVEVGETAWPLPIPVVRGDRGWYFDTEAGLDELLSRRIGRNELDAIEVCLAMTDAQREYAAADYSGDGWREYAQKFASDPGRRNGLFWHPGPGIPESPLGELAAAAAEEGYSAKEKSEGPRPYHGYFYRILTSQGSNAPGGAIDFVAQGHMIGGFGIVAWPADYGNSGLKSFMVSHHGVVYEKDLGDDTDRIARSMTSFDPGAGWVTCALESQP